MLRVGGGARFNGAVRLGVTTLTSGATITPDFAANNNFILTLETNTTLAAPSNQVAGQSGRIYIVQDATGSRTMAFNTSWKFPGGTIPTLTTTANARDMLIYEVLESGVIATQLIKDIK